MTATRTEAPASQVGASATVFTAEDLERRQMPLVADLVGTTPGAMVVRSGGPGALTSLFVRGGESDYNKVLLDGIPLNEPGGTFYLNNLTTENLERVEIVRGAYSSLFGSDAMASVIQLFTRRGDGVADGRAVRARSTAAPTERSTRSAGVSGATARRLLGAAPRGSTATTACRTAGSRTRRSAATSASGLDAAADAPVDRPRRARARRHAGADRLRPARPRRVLRARRRRRRRQRSISAHAGAFRQRASLLDRPRPNRHRPTSSPTRPTRRRSRARTAICADRATSSNDSQADLRRHHASYQADLALRASPSDGDHRLTLAGRLGRRARHAGEPAGATRPRRIRSDNFGIAAQHQMLWPRVFATVGARIEHNENFGTDRCRAQRSCSSRGRRPAPSARPG